MQKLNFGLVGCGRVAPRHADSLQEIKGARLIAVCDIKKDRADKFGKKYQAQVYYDFAEMLKNPDIDVVNICTPSGLHSKMGIMAAKAGKHVIVEKPISLTVKDADALISACQKAQVKLCVILQNRYNRAMQDLKKVVDSGKLGKINLAQICVRWQRPQSYYEDDWHGRKDMDGGAFMNQAIHHLDALIWLVGMPQSLFAYTATLAHKIEVEDVGVVTLKFANGMLASFEASTLVFPENLEGSVALFGEKGSVKVGGTALNRKVMWKIDGQLKKEAAILAKETGDPASVYGFSHKEVILDMIDAIKKNRLPQTHGLEGRKSLQVVTSIYRSSKLNKEVKIS